MTVVREQPDKGSDLPICRQTAIEAVAADLTRLPFHHPIRLIDALKSYRAYKPVARRDFIAGLELAGYSITRLSRPTLVLPRKRV